MNFATRVGIGFFVATIYAIGLPLRSVAADFDVISAKGVEAPAGVRRGGELDNGVRVRLGAGGLLIVREKVGCHLGHVFSGEIDTILRLSSLTECANAGAPEDVERRILSGETLTERVVLRAPGPADAFSDFSAVTDDPCLNLPPVSEEQGQNSRQCATGYLLSGIECSGRYCDNKRLRCCPYRGGEADPTMHNYSTRWISEESGGGRSNRYTTTDFINGLSCKGSYCDDILPHAVQSLHFLNTRACSWTAFFSEEPPSKATCPEGSFVAGMACSGRYCDSLSLQCCRLQGR